VKYQEEIPIDIEVDKLTDSIENAISGDRFDTQIIPLAPADARQIKKKDWLFDWKEELRNTKRQVFKLTIKGNPKIIQGLISLTDNQDHIFVNLIESAAFNRGKSKLYLGVPGNLFAFACQTSFDKGHEGYVAFRSKTQLISHYEQMLGAVHIGGLQMIINTKAAQVLVNKYFKIQEDGNN
jgi:hypothetical protein